ncbi:MAG TPA: hypothetical protein VIY48_02175, partial [Candidatus Paceibacterota bacterium]
MSVESATYVADLQAANPSSSDLRSQGDDHLRLLKSVLQNTFPAATRPRPIERVVSKNADYSVIATDDQTTFFIDTSGGSVTLTLPTLTAGDAGWEISFYKYGANANPVFVAPPTGNLYSGQYSVAKARRCIPGKKVSVVWNGTAFIVERTPTVPVGTMLDYDSATLPSGYEWPNGQTLSGTLGSVYPEYYAAKAALTTLDLRGRVAMTLDNLGGSAAGRLAGGVINGTAVGNSGGTDTRTLVTANLPPYTPSGTITNGAISNNSTSVIVGLAGFNNNNGGGGGNFAAMSSSYTSLSITQGTSTFSGAAQGGTSTAFGIL